MTLHTYSGSLCAAPAGLSCRQKASLDVAPCSWTCQPQELLVKEISILYKLLHLRCFDSSRK